MFSLETENDHGERFYDLYLSPSQRYVAGKWYSPYGDTAFGISLYFHDIITATGRYIYPYQAIGLSYEDGERRSLFFADIFWDTGSQLYAVVTDHITNIERVIRVSPTSR
ncbi:MAG: hypothetical protein MI724_06095 [Spirochaetales bacterium]|nr:hypothetical protein [Spirochaetales bacterium]